MERNTTAKAIVMGCLTTVTQICPNRAGKASALKRDVTRGLKMA